MDTEQIVMVNRASDDIWKLIKLAVNEKNWALLQKNLDRLHKLQGYYCQTLTNKESELQLLRNEERYLNGKLRTYEREELERLMKSNGTYQTFKNRLDEIFKEA